MAKTGGPIWSGVGVGVRVWTMDKEMEMEPGQMAGHAAFAGAAQ